MVTRLTVAIALILSILGCQTESSTTATPKASAPSAYPKKYLLPSPLQAAQPKAAEQLGAIARRADAIVVYEGLPHQHFERESFESEIATKDVIDLDEHPFYREPLEISPEDLDRIREFVTGPDAFFNFVGEKECGGFHPDYAVEWRVGQERFRLLLCFGCGEAKIFGPNLRSRHELGRDYYDFNDARGWTKVLRKYIRHRPTFVD